MMWNDIPFPWKAAFEEAWESYCHGSIPIGAVLVNSKGEVISRGRNRINESSAPARQTCATKVAHAEMNVLLQIHIQERKVDPEYTLYTTTEPCVMCFGAIVMSGISRVRFAATDPIAGGANLNISDHKFILSREIDIRSDQKFLGSIQRVLRTDYLLRFINKDKAEMLLKSESIDYPEAVELGRRWHEENRLLKAIQKNNSIGAIVDVIHRELNESNLSKT